jgi:LDH2 family malate/lactate/ureidoglycolate dehydrogenase
LGYFQKLSDACENGYSFSFSDICQIKLKQVREYSVEFVIGITQDILIKMGLAADDAAVITQVLLRADVRGIKTHGLMRLKEYYRLVKLGKINLHPHISVQHETLSTGLVDADKSFGMLAGKQAMELAIEKARQVGSGWVAVRNSNHFGIAGFYAMMALEHDMIGVTMTNANPLVAPTYSLKPLLGTNPIAVAIPADQEPPFVADFATAPVARGKLDMWHLQHKQAPDNLLQDNRGMETTDPAVLTKKGAIKTLGGSFETGGHKGFCLTAIVDILSAVLPGANFGPTVVPTLGYLPENGHAAGDKGIGHFFGAMRIDGFQTSKAFKQQMDNWIKVFRQAPSIENNGRIIIPGDPERELESLYNVRRTVPLMDEVVEEVNKIAISLGVETLL